MTLTKVVWGGSGGVHPHLSSENEDGEYRQLFFLKVLKEAEKWAIGGQKYEVKKKNFFFF